MKSRNKKKGNVDGENILYHILQKQIIQANDAVNPPDYVKYMIEQLLIWGGVWFSPETYDQIPILLPYVIRDSSCRKKDTASGKDSWGEANGRGLLRDDNSLVKAIPRSLKIHSSLPEMNDSTMGNGFVASHVWISLKNRPEHACEWERTNSFIPNLVWLPKQLSKLTDRNGSYAQQFIQHVSGLLYRQRTSSKHVLSPIWDELIDPGIKPVSLFNLNDLNYFENDEKWLNRRKMALGNALRSIINIIDGGTSSSPISCSSYASSLEKVLALMSCSNKDNLKRWIEDSLGMISTTSFVPTQPTCIAGIPTSSSKKAAPGIKTVGTSRYYTINGAGKYKMYQVIGEYLVFKLKEGKTFTEIHNEISKNTQFVSDVPTGVSVNKSRGQKPHFIEYNGKKYYITTQLRNSKPRENFSVFMSHVNGKEPLFQISQCK